MPFALTSPAFLDGQPIPAMYTCRGENVSPPLAWHDAPPGTQSFVLMLEDPDAPGGAFRHWGVYNIPAGKAALPRGVTPKQVLSAVNDFGRTGYDGPCPPPGGVHHYHFQLAALNRAALAVPPNARIAALWQEAQPYVIAKAELIGTFSP
jgi:Raf kinase inhibitor-like YbhB/YbcL family protein